MSSLSSSRYRRRRVGVLACAGVSSLALVLTSGLASAAPKAPAAGNTFSVTLTRTDGRALNTLAGYITGSAWIDIYDPTGWDYRWLREGRDYVVTRSGNTWTITDMVASQVVLNVSGGYTTSYVEYRRDWVYEHGGSSVVGNPGHWSGPQVFDVSTPTAITVRVPVNPIIYGTISDPLRQGYESRLRLGDPEGSGWFSRPWIDFTSSSGAFMAQPWYWETLDSVPTVIGMNRNSGYNMYAPSYYSSSTAGYSWTRTGATPVTLRTDTETQVNLKQATCATVAVPLSGLPKTAPDLKTVTDASLFVEFELFNPWDDEVVPRSNSSTLLEVSEGKTLTNNLRSDGTATISIPGVAPGSYFLDAYVSLYTTYTSGKTTHEYWQANPGASPSQPGTSPPIRVNSCSTVAIPKVAVPDFDKAGQSPPPDTKSPDPPVSPSSLKVLAPPKVSGKAQFGSLLKATTGSWSLTDAAFSYQWLRGGKPIPGATRATYTPVKADIGKTLGVEVTARAGALSAKSSSVKTGKVAKATPKVTLKLAKNKVASGTSGKATVTVKIPGHAKPVGTLTVKVGAQKVTVDLKAKKKGKVTVRLPAVDTKGKAKVTASFKPAKPTNAVAKAAKSKPSSLTIT
ncbi:MAG: hypothetical protein FWD59_02520 [Micrococcales bacterium]|nr:hypothetical protein [Micrococcales bacterium]